MLLKFLRALLDQFVSKNETEFIAYQAMIDTSSNNITISEDEWIAPSSGVVRMYIIDNPTQHQSLGVQIKQGTRLQQVYYYSEGLSFKTLWQPVTKGVTYVFNRSNMNVDTYSKVFFPTMGGGSLALLGGGLCLSHFLERSAKRLLAMPSLQVRKSLSPLKGKLGGKVSQLPMMGILLSMQWVQRQQSKLVDDVEQQHSRLTTVLREFQSQSAKGKVLSTTLKERQHRKAKPISSLQSLPFNLSLGGAL